MHIPDGFLNVATLATTGAVSAAGVAGAIKITKDKLKEKQVPLMGVLAAFIFAAQMLNFPVAGGTSGHFMGAALAAILLGPWAALLIMTAVLVAQSLVFQDGGLLALGANVFNMGIVGSFAGYAVYRLVTAMAGGGRKTILAASFAGSWCAIVLASVAAAFELAISGSSPLQIVLPAMTGVHALIGIGEGLITTAVLGVVLATRADLMPLKRMHAEGDAK
jgi:cobalt/nickel transport system permease protein